MEILSNSAKLRALFRLWRSTILLLSLAFFRNSKGFKTIITTVTKTARIPRTTNISTRVHPLKFFFEKFGRVKPVLNFLCFIYL